MLPFAIAAVQMNISASEDNIPKMERKLKEVMSVFPWVQMVVFSELAPFGASVSNAQPVPGSAENQFCQMAARHKVWLIPGSMYERDGRHVYNTASVIDPDGQVVGRYRKIYPFYPYEEGVDSGDQFLVFDVPNVGRFGIMICYDLWFPEVARTLAVMGAEVILQPTMTTTIDRDIEFSLVRACAAINQCYVFGVNGIGAGGVGRSVVCSPDGTIIYQAGSGEEIIPLEIDVEQVRRSRRYGVLRLGQTLKSFRDAPVHFDIYQPDTKHLYLDSLGDLVKKPD